MKLKHGDAIFIKILPEKKIKRKKLIYIFPSQHSTGDRPRPWPHVDVERAKKSCRLLLPVRISRLVPDSKEGQHRGGSLGLSVSAVPIDVASPAAGPTGVRYRSLGTGSLAVGQRAVPILTSGSD